MPFHQFDSFSGSIKQSKILQPLFPLSATPVSKAIENPPKIMYDSIKTKPVQTPKEVGRNMSTLPPHIAKKMEFYQRDIFKPVWLMGGRKDKILFGVSFTLFCYCGYECVNIVRNILKAEKNLPVDL